MISGDLSKSAKVQQNVKYDSETGKVYEELGSSSSSCNNQQQPSTSESSSLLVNSASASMINGSSPFQNGSSFQARNYPSMYRGPRFGEFCSCCCSPPLSELACIIHATLVPILA